MIILNLHKTLQSAQGTISLQLEMTVEKGQFVTLFGESGAGKTSTLRMLSGLMDPDKGHITVNGKKVNIPSYSTNVGDVIAVREKSASGMDHFKGLKDGSGRTIVQWLEVDYEKLEGRVIALPSREDIDIEIQEHLIVELYSK